LIPPLGFSNRSILPGSVAIEPPLSGVGAVPESFQLIIAPFPVVNCSDIGLTEGTVVRTQNKKVASGGKYPTNLILGGLRPITSVLAPNRANTIGG
jgi:hypothetical protein